MDVVRTENGTVIWYTYTRNNMAIFHNSMDIYYLANPFLGLLCNEM